MDEVFDLQARSQWLRRGLINRLLGKFIQQKILYQVKNLANVKINISGAPWVSQTANRRIIQAAKSLIESDKIELLLSNIL